MLIIAWTHGQCGSQKGRKHAIEFASFALAVTAKRECSTDRSKRCPVSADRDERSAEDWTAALKRLTLEAGAREVGICALRFLCRLQQVSIKSRARCRHQWALASR